MRRVMRRVWIVFVAYCLMNASSWVLPVATTRQRGEALVAAGATALLLLVLRREPRQREWSAASRAALFCLLMMAVPGWLLEWAGRYLADGWSVAALTCVPLVVALAQAGPSDQQLRACALAIAALLLVLPLPLPGGSMAWLAAGVVALAVLLVGLSAGPVYRSLQGVQYGSVLGLAAVGKGLLLLAADQMAPSAGSIPGTAGQAVVGCAVEVLGLALLVWLAGRVVPVRLAARFLLVPWLTIVEGYAVVREGLTWRLAVALVLLGVATWQALQPGREEAPALSLRAD
ncbi:MAG: hypothetical protein KGK08_07090 [Acidobacteriota bacterium]|nr:hypothetical protein [Acidobacteriota bacterium]